MKIKILSARRPEEKYVDEDGHPVPYMFYEIQIDNESPTRIGFPIRKLVNKTEGEVEEMILKRLFPNDKIDAIPDMVGKEFEV